MSLRDPKVQKIVITLAVTLTVLWSYFVADLLPFGYKRRAAAIETLRTEHQDLSAELEKARRTVGNLPKLEQENAELQKKWEQAEALLPTDKQVAQLLTQITQAGEQAGVEFELFKPGAPRPSEFFSENPVEISVKCGFHQLGIFLSRLANLSRLVNVSQLQLSGLKESNSEKDARKSKHSDHTLKASFAATAYSLRDPAAITGEQPAAEPSRPSPRRPRNLRQGGQAK